jgi:hypothetical protein
MTRERLVTSCNRNLDKTKNSKTRVWGELRKKTVTGLSKPHRKRRVKWNEERNEQKKNSSAKKKETIKGRSRRQKPCGCPAVQYVQALPS